MADGKTDSQLASKSSPPLLRRLPQRVPRVSPSQLPLQPLTNIHCRVDFLRHLSGLTLHKSDFTWANGQFQPTVLDLRITDKIRHVKPIEVANYEHMHSYLIDDWWYPLPLEDARIKTVIPSPNAALSLPGRQDVYSAEKEEEFYSDVVQAWRAEIRALAQAGCSYIQLDESHLRSEKNVALVNAVLRDRPDDMTVAIYLSRPSDLKSIAPSLFNDLNVDTCALPRHT